MSERYRDDWWLVEPPEDEAREPNYDPWILQETGVYVEIEQTTNALDQDTSHYLDGASSHPLFADIRVVENGDQWRFDTEPRVIDTQKHGRWLLCISGRRRWFKERDDYGDFRFTQTGTSLWIPHLFPFEEVDDKGIPLMRDRERCEIEISLRPASFSAFNSDVRGTVAIETMYDSLVANEAPESYNPDGVRYFTEFVSSTHREFESVTHRERRWHTFEDYLLEKNPQLTDRELLALRIATVEFPDEFMDQDRPDDWWDRGPSEYSGNAFGRIWVPVDDLVSGKLSAANISFPCFQVTST